MAATAQAATQKVPGLYRIQVPAIWRFLKSEPASFWAINFYLFIEYVRPQQVWESIDILPWGLTALLLATCTALFEGKIKRIGAPGAALLVFTGVLIASSLGAVDPAASMAKMEVYLTWVLVYLLIINTVTTEKRYFVTMLAFLLYSYKMSQFGARTWIENGFGFSDWGATGAPGWFHNSGEFGIQMCVFLPLAGEFVLALRPYWNKWIRLLFYSFPLTAIASMVASSSRGALVGGAAIGLWWVARSKHRVRSLVIIGVLGALTWAVTPAEQKARFQSAGEDETSTNRIVRWKAGIELANERPVLGIGYNNWGVVYGPLSHNIFIEAWSELGYTGLLAFLGMIATTFVVNFRTRRLLRNVPTQTKFLHHMAHGLDGALIGYLVSGFFVTVLYYPYFWINLAFTGALHAAAQHTYRVNLAEQQASARQGLEAQGALARAALLAQSLQPQPLQPQPESGR